MIRKTRLLIAVAVLVLAAAACAGPASAPLPERDPAFEHGTVEVDDATLHYARTGSGPPLVLLHGWPETWWAWHKTMPELARTHTVIAFDLPGLGDSTAPPSGYDKASTARRIHQGVQRLGYQQVQILAHDIGGHVGFAYARDFPTDVSRLAVVESPLPGFGLEDGYSFSWHFLFNATPAPIPEQLIDNDDVPTYLGMFYEGSIPPAEREPYYRAYSDPADRSAGYEYYRAFAADAADNRANAASKRLPMPVLAMGADQVFGAAVAASFRQGASDVREVIAPRSGHFIPDENPRFLIDCARMFFDGAPSDPTRPELAGCMR